MQTHGGAEAEAAILAPDRSLRWEIKVDWLRTGNYDHFLSDLSPHADNIGVDRALTGSAPAEIMLVEGAASAELQFDISGSVSPGVYGSLTVTEPMNLVGVLSPYNGVSPMYNLDPVGCEITYRIGVDTAIGTFWYPQFVGNIRTITPNRGENKVSVRALDRVEKLRQPVRFTDWGVLDAQANQGLIKGQLMNAHWVLDHCLKTCDTSASPYRWPYDREVQFPPTLTQATTQIFLSGNGGIAPNVGWVDGSYQNQFTDVETSPTLSMYHDRGEAHPGSPEPAARPEMIRAQRDWGNELNIYWAADKPRVLAAKTHLVSFVLHAENYAGSQWFLTMADTKIMDIGTKNDRFLEVWVGLGKMWLRYTDAATSLVSTTAKITIPTGAGDEYVECTARLQYGNGAGTAGERMQLLVGSTLGSFVNMQNLRGWGLDSPTGRFRLWRTLAVQDITYTTYDYFSTPTNALVDAKYAAVLDRSLNKLSFLPKRNGAMAWDVISEVAAAEFGAVFWDEDGAFHFWNQDTILDKKDDFVRTFTLDDVSGLEITQSTDSIRNIFSITGKKSRVQNVRVFETTGPDELYLLPGQFTKIRIWDDTVVTPNSGQIPTYQWPGGGSTLPDWSEYVNFGLLSQRLVGGTWVNTPTGTPWLGFMYREADGSSILWLWNGYGEPIRFSDPNGGPAFRWNGSKMTTFDDQTFVVSDKASIDRWGPQGLPLQSDWYQEFFEYGTFFTKMLTRTTKPIPTTQNITVSGDPRIQLGDAAKILDPGGLGEEMRIQILGINRFFTRDEGLIDTYTVEMTEPPRIGIWDSAQYGVWDASFIWS